MKIRLKNCWEHREYIIARCLAEHACWTEFKKLIEAKTEKSFRGVLLDNFGWVICNNIIHHGIRYVSSVSYKSFRNGKTQGVALENVYCGSRYWVINSMGELVEKW